VSDDEGTGGQMAKQYNSGRKQRRMGGAFDAFPASLLGGDELGVGFHSRRVEDEVVTEHTAGAGLWRSMDGISPCQKKPRRCGAFRYYLVRTTAYIGTTQL